MFVFRESGCIRIKVVEFGKNWLCSCKGGCIRKKDAVFEQKLLFWGKSCCIQAKWLYSGKSDCIWVKFLYSVKSGCIREKWL